MAWVNFIQSSPHSPGKVLRAHPVLWLLLSSAPQHPGCPLGIPLTSGLGVGKIVRGDQLGLRIADPNWPKGMGSSLQGSRGSARSLLQHRLPWALSLL